MVQLLLLTLLAGLTAVFLFCLKLYFILKDIRSAVYDEEAELIKFDTRLTELENKLSQLESKLSFITTQYRLLREKLREG